MFATNSLIFCVISSLLEINTLSQDIRELFKVREELEQRNQAFENLEEKKYNDLSDKAEFVKTSKTAQSMRNWCGVKIASMANTITHLATKFTQE